MSDSSDSSAEEDRGPLVIRRDAHHSSRSIVQQLREINQYQKHKPRFNQIADQIDKRLRAQQEELAREKETNARKEETIARLFSALRDAEVDDTITLVDRDGRTRLACKKTLVQQSPVVKAMLTSGAKEQRTNEIQTDENDGSLRLVLFGLRLTKHKEAFAAAGCSSADIERYDDVCASRADRLRGLANVTSRGMVDASEKHAIAELWSAFQFALRWELVSIADLLATDIAAILQGGSAQPADIIAVLKEEDMIHALMVNQEALTSDITGWRSMSSIDEVRAGTVVRIMADEGTLKTRMSRTAAGATTTVKYASGHAGKEGKIRQRTNAGNAMVEFGGGGSSLFPWDALMVQAEPSSPIRKVVTAAAKALALAMPAAAEEEGFKDLGIKMFLKVLRYVPQKTIKLRLDPSLWGDASYMARADSDPFSVTGLEIGLAKFKQQAGRDACVSVNQHSLDEGFQQHVDEILGKVEQKDGPEERERVFQKIKGFQSIKVLNAEDGIQTRAKKGAPMLTLDEREFLTLSQCGFLQDLTAKYAPQLSARWNGILERKAAVVDGKVCLFLYHPCTQQVKQLESFSLLHGYTTLSQDLIQDHHDEDGGLKIEGEITISASQRRYELFSYWLQVSGRTEALVSVPAALTCLRLIIGGVDACHNLESLRAEAEKRGLSSAENDLECLQVRLADSVSAETQLSLDEDAVLVCKSLVDLMADGGFRRLCRVRPRSLWQLDATSMSQVLAHRKLDVDSESAVMDVVCKWALHPGRSIEVVDKVMPLVRFPLIDSLLTPSRELKELKTRSAVVAELWEEAIEAQFRGAFTGKKHRLIPGVSIDDLVPRNKRRKMCKDDKVPQRGLVRALDDLVFGAAQPHAGLRSPEQGTSSVQGLSAASDPSS